MKTDREGTFLKQPILEQHLVENFSRRFINHHSTDLAPLQRIILKRFYVRCESVAEIAARLKIRPDQVYALLEHGVSKIRQTEKRVVQKSVRPKLPEARSCEHCGRRLKALYPDVYCGSCIREEVRSVRGIGEAS